VTIKHRHKASTALYLTRVQISQAGAISMSSGAFSNITSEALITTDAMAVGIASAAIAAAACKAPVSFVRRWKRLAVDGRLLIQIPTCWLLAVDGQQPFSRRPSAARTSSAQPGR
jgi:hypothetical protein